MGSFDWRPVAQLGVEQHSVYAGAFSADGKKVVAIASDTSVRIWDATDGRLLSAVFSPNGRYILTTQRNGNEAWLWSADGQARISVLALPERVSYATFSQDGNRIAVLGGSSLRVWDSAQTAQMIEGPDPGSPIRSAAFSADGQRIVMACEDSTVRMWVIEEDITVLGTHWDTLGES